MSREISFRDRVHKDSFRFVVTPDFLKALYGLEEEGSNLITVVEEERLRGYALYFTFVRGHFRAFSVLDIVADNEATQIRLIDGLIERAKKDNADFIYIRKEASPLDRVFDKKGFLSFVDSKIMVTLLNLHELLSALSQEVQEGNKLRLNIKGFDPIEVKVGKNTIQIVERGKPDLTVSTDSETFLKLLFCRTSFWKEFLKRKIMVTRGARGLLQAHQFFKLIQQEKWHIPYADWV